MTSLVHGCGKQLLAVVQDLEHAVRLELTNTGFAIPRLSRLATRAYGTEGEIRTLESSLEDSHVSSYITSAGSADPDGPRLGCGARISNSEIGTPGGT